MMKGQPKWVIILSIGVFSGFSFVILYNLSKQLGR